MDPNDTEQINQAYQFFEKRPHPVVQKLMGKLPKSKLKSFALPAKVEQLLARQTEKALAGCFSLAYRSLEAGPRGKILNSAKLNRGLNLFAAASTQLLGPWGALFDLPGQLLFDYRTLLIEQKNFPQLDQERLLLESFVIFNLMERPWNSKAQSFYWETRQNYELDFRQILDKRLFKLNLEQFLGHKNVRNLIKRMQRNTLVQAKGKGLIGLVPPLKLAIQSGQTWKHSDHLVKTARFHFGLLALEKRFGQELVKKMYLEQAQANN